MGRAFLGRRGLLLVAALLAVQLGVLVASFGPWLQVSIFCTGPRSSTLAGLFGAVHMLFAGLLLVGALSVRFPSLRLPYAALLVVGLTALPMQASLVSNGQLKCDLP
jgi:hypothetical protein